MSRISRILREAEESNIPLMLELTDIYETTSLGIEFDRKVRENIEHILKRDCLWNDGLEIVVLPDVTWNPEGAFFGGFEVFNDDEIVASGKYNGLFAVLDEEVFTKPQVEGIEIIELTISIPPGDAKRLLFLSFECLNDEEKTRMLSDLL